MLALAKQALRSDSAAASRYQMVLCGFATGLPLLIGLHRHEIAIALYGALIGYLLTVYDFAGTLRHRLAATTITFLMLVSGLALGLYLQNSYAEYLVVLGVLTYWVGVLGGEGAELEKALLFSSFQVIIGVHSTVVGPEHAMPVLKYGFVAYVFVVLAVVTQWYALKPPVGSWMGLRESLKKPLSSRLNLHLHAMSYLIVTLIAALLMDHFQVERGYWTVITVLLVMKPDPLQSVYRCFQRLVGTCGGALLSAGIVFVFRSPESLVCLITLSAFFVPWAMKRNYWLVSFLITIIVILLLALPLAHHGDFHTPLMRLRATAVGSALGIVGVLLTKGLSRLIAQIPTDRNGAAV